MAEWLVALLPEQKLFDGFMRETTDYPLFLFHSLKYFTEKNIHLIIYKFYRRSCNS